MEEQRQRQEEEARKASATEGETQETSSDAQSSGREETLLQKALEMSLAADKPAENISAPDFQSMTEDEQIAYAVQMSLQQAHESTAKEDNEPMETDDDKKEEK